MVAPGFLSVESPYIRRSRRPRARCRLFCFPHAGGGISEFNDWPELLPPEVEVVGVQLPGRQDRIKEEPFTALDPLVRTLTHVVRPLIDMPIAFFGHSGGALLAFELARALQQQAEAIIVGVFPSGQGAPHMPLPPPIHDLPETEFQQFVGRLGGTAGQVAADQALMAFLGPTLRADFRLWESYRYRQGEPLAASILAFGASDDERAPVHALEAWREHTTGPFALKIFPGGHFFIKDFSVDVARALGDDLLRSL